MRAMVCLAMLTALPACARSSHAGDAAHERPSSEARSPSGPALEGVAGESSHDSADMASPAVPAAAPDGGRSAPALLDAGAGRPQGAGAVAQDAALEPTAVDAAVGGESRCDSVPDEALWRVMDEGPVVPPEFYQEPSDSLVVNWMPGCFDSADELASFAQPIAHTCRCPSEAGAPTERYYVLYFGRADPSQPFHQQVRGRRCDYFDGETMSGAPFDSYEPLRDLATFLWWTELKPGTFVRAVAGFGSSHDTPEGVVYSFEICTLSASHRELPLNEVVLSRTVYTVDATGRVMQPARLEVRRSITR